MSTSTFSVASSPWDSATPTPRWCGGNAISMAAVDATLDVMEREDTPRRSAERGAQLRAQLETFKDKYRFIGDVRGMGLMQALELVEDRATKQPAPKKTLQLLEAAKRQGLLIGKGGLYGNVIRIARRCSSPRRRWLTAASDSTGRWRRSTPSSLPPPLPARSERDTALPRLRVGHGLEPMQPQAGYEPLHET